MLKVESEDITAYRKQIDERKRELPIWERNPIVSKRRNAGP
ncbi:MAG: hypothetical protein ACI4S1_13150 [Roseburia sp.]